MRGEFTKDAGQQLIDLAPASKQGLELAGPIVLAGGYADGYSPFELMMVNGFVTNPTSLRPRSPKRGQTRVSEFPGGFLRAMRAGNPGLAAVMRVHRHDWKRMRIPVILSLASGDERNWAEIARRVTRMEVIAGLELEVDEKFGITESIREVKAETDLPILCKIPVAGALEHAGEAIRSGADALTIGLGPIGSRILDGREWMGRMGGPAVKLFVLRALFQVAEAFPGVPLVAAGGVHDTGDVRDLLLAGASAIQIDTALWREPELLHTIGGLV